MLAVAVVPMLKATDEPTFAMAYMRLFPVFVIRQLIELSLSCWLAVPLGILFGVVPGLAIERLVIREVLSESHFASVLMAIGGSVAFGAAVHLAWKSERPGLDAPVTRNLKIDDVVILLVWR